VAVNGFTIIATLFIIVLYEKLSSNYKLQENKCCDCPTLIMVVKEFLLTVS
jgi:hypothetical protein